MFSFHLDVESEIAHFRDPTSHAFLNTFMAPPPHTIIGFLGACSGFSEQQTEDLTKKLKVGCIVLRLKGFLKDLVIMDNQKNKQNTKFPRTRKFLVDPKYRLFVASEDYELLIRLRQNILSPKHVPYLGISDCLAYTRNISAIENVEPIQIKETESVVGIEEGQQEIDFYTKIKEPNYLTVYAEIVNSTTAFSINEKGRKPVHQRKFLMPVNCRLFFRKPLEGYQINGENVCLL
jgi:CRISPR-associated protein Cas5 subtype I-B